MSQIKNVSVFGSLILGAGALAALALPAASAAPVGQGALPAVGTVTRTAARPGSALPGVVGGVLTAPSTRAPTDIASRYLATAPAVLGGADPASLVQADVRALTRGHLVRYAQTFKGLEVIGGETAVRVDAEGRVRWVSSGAVQIPDTLSITPALARADAFRDIGHQSGYTDADLAGVDVDRFTRLVVYAQPNMQPRLAWWVELPRDMVRLQTIRAFVDAETGFVYRRENLIRFGGPVCPNDTQLAHIFEVNPTVTPELSCVSLSGLLDPSATELANDDVALANCIDNKNCQMFQVPGVGDFNIHFCDQTSTATADQAGDFTAHTFISDTEPEDPFSEVQMFWHVNKVYAAARALGGFTDLNEKPLAAVVNFRTPSFDLSSICQGETYTGAAELQPFDNALFASAGTLGSFPAEDSIVFGQGTTRDFAYDGDVVYHEFGHAVMATVAPQLSFGFIDDLGFNPMAGGMHEGWADLMTMFVTNDPEIGEYAGAGLAGPGATSIRNIENSATCPANLIGQVHQDSIPFTGAIWEARGTVTTDEASRTTFDESLFAVQQTLGAFDDFETTATRIVAELETSFDATVAEQVETILEGRGMMGCADRTQDGAAGKPLMFLTGTDQAQGVSEVPAFVQFTYELPEDATQLIVDIAASQSGGFGGGGFGGGEASASMKVVAKAGDQPINWSTSGALAGDHEFEGPITFQAGGNMGGQGVISGGFPAGTYQLQIVNTGPTWVLQQVSVSHSAGDITPDAGPMPMPDAGDPGADTDESGGCCRVAGTGPDAAGAMLLALLCLVALRRRRA
jgi:hypothetical protein